MRDEPYAGMGNVSKAEGLYLQKKEKKKKEMKKIKKGQSKEQTFFFSRTKEGYSMIPNQLIREKTIIEIARFAYIVGVSFADSTTREAFAGREKIGEIVGVTPNYLSKLYGELRKAGWITTITRGLNKTNIIIFHSYKGEEISEDEKQQYKAKVEVKIRNSPDWTNS